ncbi:hypothetical protein ABT001_33065 [Streptomyces sp. NPDC002793]|uniref:hypothetical protein n=1 Tax=Streptomyces sp. NPDC002793 TaxID=3154432 RepID=UPI0033291844
MSSRRGGGEQDSERGGLLSQTGTRGDLVVPQQHVSLKSGFDAGVEKGGRSEDELAGVVLVEHASKTPFAVFFGNLGYVAEHVGE